jgi:hypothetical protein
MKLTVSELKELIVECINSFPRNEKIVKLSESRKYSLRDDVGYQHSGIWYKIIKMNGDDVVLQRTGADSLDGETYADTVKRITDAPREIVCKLSDLTPTPSIPKYSISEFKKYVSSAVRPNYLIRFTSNPYEHRSVSELTMHDTVPTGMYAFPFTEEIACAISGDDDIGLGVYLEDIAVSFKYAAILETNFQNPLLLNRELWNDIEDLVKKEGSQGATEILLKRGHDALIDTSGIIDGMGTAGEMQVCVLKDSAIKFVKTLKF